MYQLCILINKFTKFANTYNFCNIPADIRRYFKNHKITNKAISNTIVIVEYNKRLYFQIQKYILATGRRFSDGSTSLQQLPDEFHRRFCIRIGKHDIGVASYHSYKYDDQYDHYQYVDASDFMYKWMPELAHKQPLT